MFVDRYAKFRRLMIKDKSGKEFPIARFSLGFADKFEKFSQRVNCTAKNEPIDDRLLEGVKTHCLPAVSLILTLTALSVRDV